MKKITNWVHYQNEFIAFHSSRRFVSNRRGHDCYYDKSLLRFVLMSFIIYFPINTKSTSAKCTRKKHQSN